MASRTEEVVLRISMIADDEATRKVQQLNQQLSQLPQPVQKGMRESTKQVSEFQEALGKLSRHALGVTGDLVDLAKIIGPVGGGIALIGVELVRSIAHAKEWARAVIDMGNAAKMAGLQPGVFRDLTNQFERMGVKLPDATQTLTEFNQAVAETTQASSSRRDSLLRMAGAQRELYTDEVRRIATLQTTRQRLNEVRHFAENQYWTMRKNGVDETTARIRQQQILEVYGAKWLITVNQDFTEASAEQVENWNKQTVKAQELNAELVKEAQLRDQIFEKTFGWVTGLETKALKLIELLESPILDQLKQGPHIPLATPEHPASAAPGLQPGKTKEDWKKALGPQMFGADPADVLGLAPGSLGHGDITQGWRHSENVQDSRDALQQHVDDVARHGTAVDTSTKEFRQLNQNIQQLIDTGVFGPPVAMAEGGVVAGPTNALVGEAGPEAIISKSGTSIVNKPTRMMLGTDGAQAVVPLSSAGADIDKTISGFAKSESGERSIMRHDYAASLVENLAGLRAYNPQEKELLRKFMVTGGQGMHAIDVAWCASTVRSAYTQAGLGGSLGGTNAVASSFNTWQKEVKPEDIQRGDVLTLPAIKNFRSGHVGVAAGPYDPKTQTVPFASGNTALGGKWVEGGAAAVTNLPVGGTGTDRLLSARRDVPRIELHSPGPASSSRVAMMAEGGLVVPMGAAPPGLGGPPASSSYGLTGDADTLTPAGRAAAAAVQGAGSAAAGYASGIWQEARQRQAEIGAAQKTSTWPEFSKNPFVSPIKAIPDVLGRLGLFGGYGPTAQKYKGPDQEPPTGGLLSRSLEEQYHGSPLARDAGLNDIRATVDRSFGSGRGGGTTEGTITIEHQETGRSGPRKAPLFRKPQIARQTQMQPAEHGPENHWANSEEAVH
jgi:hypothetical protein